MRYLIKIYEIKVPVPGQSPQGNNLQDQRDLCPQGKANKKTAPAEKQSIARSQRYLIKIYKIKVPVPGKNNPEGDNL